MNLIIESHPNYSTGITPKTKIRAKITITDLYKPYVIFQKDISSTLEELNKILNNIQESKTGYFQVSLSLSYYNSDGTLIPCVDISPESSLMIEWNKAVENDDIRSSVGILKTNNSKDGKEQIIYIYLIPEEDAKNDMDWNTKKYEYDGEQLKDDILSIESEIANLKQKMEIMKKLSTDVIYAQNDILNREKDLSRKFNIEPLIGLYQAYQNLSNATLTPELRAKYNSIIAIQRNWNTLAQYIDGLKIIE
jgi:hypothetical protein